MSKHDQFSYISRVFDDAFDKLRADVVGWFKCIDNPQKEVEIVLLRSKSSTVQFPWIVCRYLPLHMSFVERYSFKTEAEAMMRFNKMVDHCVSVKRKRA